MPSISDMLANPSKYGVMGGIRQGEEDVRTQEMHDVDVEGKKTDTSRKQEELKDYVHERSMRRKAQKVKEDELDWMGEHADELDERRMAEVKEATSKSYDNYHSTELESFSRMFGQIKNAKDYNNAYNSMEEGEKDKLKEIFGWEPSGNWKEDEPMIRLLERASQYNASHKRAMEKELWAYQKALAKANASAKGYKPFSPKLIQRSANSHAMALDYVRQDPQFEDAFTKQGWLDDGDAMNAQASMLIDIANDKIQYGNSLAKAMGSAKYEVTQGDAMRQAVKEQKYLQHKIEKDWLGDKKVVMMKPAEYQQKMMEWETSALYYLSKKPGWDNLTDGQKNLQIRNFVVADRQRKYMATMETLDNE